MIKKKLATLLFVAVATIGGIASAQENQPPPPRPDHPIQALRETVDTVATALGIEPTELMNFIRDGATIAEVIETENGDLESIITDVEAVMTERINQAVEDGILTQARADVMLESLNDRIREAFNTTLERGRQPLERLGQWTGEIVDILTESTGLEPAELRTQLGDGAILNDLIMANGADPQGVSDDILAVVSERINSAVADGNLTQDRADTLLAEIADNLPLWMSGERPLPIGDRPEQGGRHGENGQDENRGAFPLVREIADATGLTPQAIQESLQSGATFAQVLTDNGVDVEAFIADHLTQYETQLQQAVDNGRFSQDVADARLNLRRAELTDILNRTLPNRQ